MSSSNPGFEILAIRALNAYRLIHSPSYAALRVLLETGRQFQSVFRIFCERRTRIREIWRYLPFQIVKEAGDGVEPIYRDCLAGSPVTAIAETYVLSAMASEPAFKVPPCAYSYQWPNNANIGRNFNYFYIGYKQRNAVATSQISSSARNVAVVMDIKSFYPSVDRSRLLERVSRRIGAVAQPNPRRCIGQYINSYLSSKLGGGRGIPIGPELSHALGHIALEKVDERLGQQYGSHYLRYVDDIVIITPQKEADLAVQRIREALADEGLEPNESKTDRVDRATWLSECVSRDQVDAPDSFDTLFDAITMYLMKGGADLAALQSLLRNEGFSIPVNRLRSRGRSTRFRMYLRRRVGWFKWCASLFSTPESILKQAKLAREDYLGRAKSLCSQSPPGSPMRLRWYVQARRYVLNRLLYLLSADDYNGLLHVSPKTNEFFQLRYLARAISSGDAPDLLKYPGRLVNGFCELWSEIRQGVTPRIEWPSQPSQAESESAASRARSRYELGLLAR